MTRCRLAKVAIVESCVIRTQLLVFVRMDGHQMGQKVENRYRPRAFDGVPAVVVTS
jgi:hypothetical protein